MIRSMFRTGIPARASTCGVVALLALLAAGAAGSAASDDPPTAAAPSPSSAAAATTVLITGANRGIGLEFARQFKAAGANVIGTARHPADATELKALGARVEQLDVTDAKSVTALVGRLGDVSIDILVNNAGIGGRTESIEQFDAEQAAQVYDVNCLGPMRVTQALLPALRRGRGRTVVQITSGLGSIERNTHGHYYGYRESKAALNMFNRSLAAELAPEGFICIVMSPGWVRTGMGGPSAPLSPEESVTDMRKVIAGLTPERSGRFFDHTGEEVPW